MIIVVLWVASKREEDAARGVPMTETAELLGVSYETVRRRVSVLKEEGRCETARGLVRLSRSAEALDRRSLDRLFLCVETLCREANRLELSAQARPSVDKPVAAAAALGFFIDLIHMLRTSFEVSVLDVVLLSGVHRVNVARMAEDGGGEGGPLIPLSARRAASIFQVAKSLSLPYETVRRRLIALQAKGLIQRDEAEGVIARTTLESNPDLIPLTAENARRVETVMAGVLGS